LFVEQLATNSTYFKDPRLIDIFAMQRQYRWRLVKQSIGKRSERIRRLRGQYFKMLTVSTLKIISNTNVWKPLVGLLRTSKKSIRAIGASGYKDTAYFCRRFKMMFGIPAGKMRRRESLMNL
jgi:AraC-like DNA-binding protein